MLTTCVWCICCRGCRSLRRHYYTTPTSYLELIQTYKELLATKRQQVSQMRNRCAAVLPMHLPQHPCLCLLHELQPASTSSQAKELVC